MLEKLITNLKNSLPEPLRKKLGGDEETEDRSEESDESEVQNKGNGASAESAEDKKKNSTSMLIRVVVIIALGYLALDEFVLKKSDTGTDQASEAAIVAKTKARAAKKREEAMAASKAAEATTATATETAPSTAQVLDAPQDPTPPIENVNILDKNETPVESQAVAETPATEAPAEVISSKVVDTSVDHKLDQLVENVDQSTPTTSTTEEVKIPSQPAPKKDNSMASKIVEEVTETLPPSYDQVGRGLVYNCKDKYWACVDKAAYVTCNKNMKWNKSKGGSMECVVQNIYNSDEDCAKIQKYNVSTIQPTAFCQ